MAISTTRSEGSARPQFLFDKRWKGGRELWVPPGPMLNPAEYAVELMEGEREARTFVEYHHYSGTYPAARLAIGLYRKMGVHRPRLVGVAVFSVPLQGAAISCYTGFQPHQGVELGRFVLLDEVPFNGESWFLRRAMHILQEMLGGASGVQCFISYADPLERRTADGLLVKPAHAGQIYQASNAVFTGRAAARWLWMAHSGHIISQRALSKIVLEERGQAYATRQLLELGAEPRSFLEHPRTWLDRVLPQVARRVKHPGNFVFAFGLNPKAREQVLALNDGGMPYPKLPPAETRRTPISI